MAINNKQQNISTENSDNDPVLDAGDNSAAAEQNTENAQPAKAIKKNWLQVFLHRARKNKLYATLGVIIAAIPIILVCLLVKNFMTSHLLDIQLLTYNTYIDVAELQGITVKDESVLTAPADGTIHFTRDDQTKIAKGTKVATVTTLEGKEEAVYADSGGILIYGTDGLEPLLKKDKISSLDWSSIDFTAKQSVAVAEGSAVTSGQEICKITDNLSIIYIVAGITQQQLEEAGVEKKNNIKIRWDADTTSNAYVEDIVAADDNLYMVLWAQNYPDKAAWERIISFELVNQSLSGYVLPKTALVYKNDVPGIYIVYKETVRWVEVEIENEAKEMVQITGDELTASIQVVMNPNLIKEGLSLF